MTIKWPSNYPSRWNIWAQHLWEVAWQAFEASKNPYVSFWKESNVLCGRNSKSPDEGWLSARLTPARRTTPFAGSPCGVHWDFVINACHRESCITLSCRWSVITNRARQARRSTQTCTGEHGDGKRHQVKLIALWLPVINFQFTLGLQKLLWKGLFGWFQGNFGLRNFVHDVDVSD